MNISLKQFHLHWHQILLIFAFLSIISCIETEVDINQFTKKSDKLPYEIVVEGGIMSLYGKQFVRLSEPSSFSGSDLKPISNAILEVFDGKNFYKYAELEEAGEYETIDSIRGEIGKKYVLTIRHNGKIFSASDSLIANETVHDQIPITKIYYDENERIYTNSRQHNFGFDESNVWIINQGKFSTGDFLQLSPINIFKAERKIFTHSVVLPQGLFPSGFSNFGNAGYAEDTTEYLKLSISPEYHNYLISLFNETDWASGIFSSIRGNTSTNVSEGGRGFFYASDVEVIRMKFGDLKTLAD